MNWNEFFLLAILFNTISGTCILGVWYLLKRLLVKSNDILLFYRLLKVVIVFYLLPVLIVALMEESRTVFGWTGWLHLSSEVMRSAGWVFLWIWFTGFLWKGKDLWLWERKCREIQKHSVCASEKDLRLLEECCNRVGIDKKRVSLRYSSIIATPLVYGFWRPNIYFPLIFPMKEEEKKAALLHEVIHYKKHDTRWRYLAEFVHCFQWFNPFARRLLKEVGEWSEACCDYLSGSIYGNLKEYYHIVAGRTLSVEEGYFGFHMSLFYTGEEYLERRLKRVKSYQNAKKKGRWFPTACASLFFVLSSGTVWAATEGALDLYKQVYKATVVEREELSESVEILTEHHGRIAGSASMYVEEAEPEGKVPGSSIPFDWAAKPGELHASPSFSCGKLSRIEVMVSVKPAGQTIRVGVIDPDGQVFYVNGSGYICHTFPIQKGGKYRFYVENTSETGIQVDGSYVKP